MRIAFLYIAEAYQCYHAAAIGLTLAAMPGIHVVNYYNDPETPAHLERIRLAHDGPAIEARRLHRSGFTSAMQSMRRFGMFKRLVMRDNLADLNRYDAIVAVEATVSYFGRRGLPHPRLIYLPHGTGDRAVGFRRNVAHFDLVLLAGRKTAERMRRDGVTRPGQYALIGSPKLETAALVRETGAELFATRRPIVLYNAHKDRRLSSWPRFIEPMLEQFTAQDRFNLIAAPHVKMFRRRDDALRARWRARSTPNILVDPGSDRSVDMTYTAAADIYVGDVSSQVYEFLETPRPCVFLDRDRRRWRDDPSYAHWHFGDVVVDPADLMATIAAAPARHHLYRARQEEWAAASLGDRSPGIAQRGADAIMALLAQ